MSNSGALSLMDRCCSVPLKELMTEGKCGC